MSRFALIAAPLLMFAYGVVRIFDGLDGHYGPGPAWTAGHVLFLGSLLLFGVGLVALRRASLVLAAVGLAGLAAFVRVAVVDIVVGLRASGPEEKSVLADRYADVPHVLPSVFYEVGPLLFMVGLVGTLVVLAVRRALPWWSPVLVAAGFAAITVRTGLLPVGAAVLAAGLLPAAVQAVPARKVRR
ncbi:hypothetical protein [Actinomadura parmotrematis]|uniref:Uncharacterized protein n=1 Tax=Actinomadura parmotrematis TaxID=2864039 RepID=A0ABS7FN58_9ACTN|nr:hypothetical protein [Actinomadura parmotrematis]MBW8481822.1 hypothetical protein [Actinomadura parmotrematis]